MLEPRLDAVTCASPAGLHRMAYWEWGDPGNDRVLLCVHGLTRTGRDFDTLARRLAHDYRVVCPDVVGRGRSDRLNNPAFYTVPQYVADMVTLLARLRARHLAWVGTSMGGLIGMALGGSSALARRHPNAAAGPVQAPDDPGIAVQRMVINDVGPRIEADALGRIGQYVGQPMAFDSFDEAVAYTRQVSCTFGPHSETQWQDLARHTYPEHEGRWTKHYDLQLAVPFALSDANGAAVGEQLLWHAYEALDCPILLMRGAQSDLLSPDTADEMLARNPRARLIQVGGVGHAPTLMHADQVEPVAEFLLQGLPA